MSQNDTDREQKREKSYRRKKLREKDKIDVQIGKKTVVRLKPKAFYFSF